MHDRQCSSVGSLLAGHFGPSASTVKSLIVLSGVLMLLPLVAGAAVKIDSATFGGLQARSIGPAVMSGRIAAIDGVASDPNTIYVGAASGGVWKTEDGGIDFDPVFDDHPQSIGAIRVDQNNPESVWVGTGESWVRNSVSIGDGVYHSSDGGDTWQNMGLTDSEHISAIRISSQDSDTVFVCALGHAWNANEERGVFKTDDGGKTWRKVLYVDSDTGCADLDIDPNNPSVLFAGMWDFRRSPDFFRSGGPGSGMYRSIDGGESWQKLTQGLPETELGRIAVAIAPSRPNTIYATIESEETALYRSDDLGANWREINDSRNVQFRPFYFSELVIDPEDHQRVYKPGFTLTVSIDGGDSFSSFFSGGGAASIHPDHHALWIDPNNPKRLILGTDGGVYISYDQSQTWRLVGQLPVSQFYHVSHDLQWPYNVYGGLQDNGSWKGPSQAPGGIQAKDWRSVGFGDGFWVFVDPNDPQTVYSEYQGGQLMRVDLRLNEIKRIQPVASDGQEELRFNWNTPIHLSPNQKGRLYYGSQHLHVSDDRGESWRSISPDLTTDDPQRQRQLQSGGLTIDNSTAENNATIYTISESPLQDGLIWVGSDDGLVHLTRDGGQNWDNLTDNIPGLPEGTWVSRIEASPHQAGHAHATFDGHRTGDMTTYVYETRDFGASWQSIVTDQIEGYAWVIKQDPVNADLLFLGTELGLYVSLDRGQNWSRFKQKLPKVSVQDLVIHPTEHDVIVGTHGRGVYIIDDISPLRALTLEAMEENVALLPSRPAVMLSGGALQSFGAGDQFVGANPSQAGVITYHLKKRHLFGDMLIKVYDSNDELISTIPGGKRRGINRVEWPMRLKPPKFPPSTTLVPGFLGPRVPEGVYRIELIKGKETLTGQVELVADPRSPHVKADRDLQQKTTMQLYGMLSRLTYLSESMLEVRKQLLDRAGQLSGRDARRMNGWAEEIQTFNRKLAATAEGGMISGESQLREKLGNLYGNVSGYDGRPSDTQLQRTQILEAELVKFEAEAQEWVDAELEGINRILQRRELDSISRQSREDWTAADAGGGVSSAVNANSLHHFPQLINLIL